MGCPSLRNIYVQTSLSFGNEVEEFECAFFWAFGASFDIHCPLLPIHPDAQAVPKQVRSIEKQSRATFFSISSRADPRAKGESGKG